MTVANTLQRELARAKVGERVSSEHEIASRFGLNRLTARAALDELERRYLVRRVQGHGTYVARRVDYRVGPLAPASWSETVRAAGGQPRSELESIRARRAPVSVARELALGEQDRVWLVARRRYVDGELAGCADTYVPVELAPDLPKRLASDGSLTATLTERYDAEPVRGSYRAELQLPPDRIAQRLGLDDRPWMLLTQGRSDCRRRSRPLELSTVWLRADVFRLVVEFGA
ncbi:MAG: GntR family transcriptional regulator, nutrient-sensing system regulator [Solirubrobacteraceae bacterium]